MSSKLPPPPTVEGLQDYAPGRGLARWLALCYVHRVPLACAAVSVASALLTVTANLPLETGPGAASEIADAKPVAEPEVDVPAQVAPSLPAAPGPAEPAMVQDGAARDEAPHVPQPDLPDLPEQAVGGQSDLDSLELADLAEAIDNLGIKVSELEKVLPPRETPSGSQDEGAERPAPAASVLPDPVVSPSGEDATLRERLVSRLTEARGKDDPEAVRMAESELSMFDSTLRTEIGFRIVDREDERPGFWRYEKGNESNRQFFVVVEAVVEGERVNWAVRDADSGRVVSGPRFALRVDEQTFAGLAADKKDNGRIDGMAVGIKPVGRIAPVWSIKTDGTTITGF